MSKISFIVRGPGLQDLSDYVLYVNGNRVPLTVELLGQHLHFASGSLQYWYRASTRIPTTSELSLLVPGSDVYIDDISVDDIFIDNKIYDWSSFYHHQETTYQSKPTQYTNSHWTPGTYLNNPGQFYINIPLPLTPGHLYD